MLAHRVYLYLHKSLFWKLSRHYKADYKWLDNPNNIQNGNYYSNFKKQYGFAIKNKNIENAATLVGIAGSQYANGYLTNDTFLGTAIDFFNAHKSELSNAQKNKIVYGIACQYETLQQIDSTFLWLYKAEIKAENYEVYQYQGYCNISKATLFAQFKNRRDTSIEILLNTIPLFQKMGDTANVSTAYINVGIFYRNLKLYDKSIFYTQKGINLAIKCRDTASIFNGTIGAALDYYKTSNINQYIIKAREAYEYNANWSNASNYTNTLSNYYYAYAFLLQNNIDSCMHYYGLFKNEVGKFPSLKTKEMLLNSEIQNFKKMPLSNRSEILALADEAVKEKDFVNAVLLYAILRADAKLMKNLPTALEMDEKHDMAKDSLLIEKARFTILTVENKYNYNLLNKELLTAKRLLKSRNIIIFLTLLIAIGIIVLIIFFTRHKNIIDNKKKEVFFLQHTLDSVENERERIAINIHDGLGHDLLQLKNKATEKEDKNAVSNIINEVREISRNLHPIILKNVGLALSLENLIDNFTQSSGIYSSHNIDACKDILDIKKELHVYRICQEALNNIQKHAKATACSISLVKEKELVLTIKDNGQGFNEKEKTGNENSFGLFSFTQRSAYLGGVCKISSNNTGTTIEIKIPI